MYTKHARTLAIAILLLSSMVYPAVAQQLGLDSRLGNPAIKKAGFPTSSSQSAHDAMESYPDRSITSIAVHPTGPIVKSWKPTPGNGGFVKMPELFEVGDFGKVYYSSNQIGHTILATGVVGRAPRAPQHLLLNCRGNNLKYWF